MMEDEMPKAKEEKVKMPFWKNFTAHALSTATLPTTPPDGYREVAILHCPNCDAILSDDGYGKFLSCWRCHTTGIEIA
jgi:hypothetical protein